jgi:hypothetical protein
LPKGELDESDQRISNSGFHARTLLAFSWKVPWQGRALKDEALGSAVDIETVAKDLLDGQAQSPPKGKGKGPSPTGKAKSSDENSTEGTKKLPKWLSKLGKK